VSVSLLLFGVVTGLALAAIYLLLSIGFNVILASSGTFNFALGTIAAGGTIASYYSTVKWGWSPIFAALLISGGGAVAAYAIYLVAIKVAMRSEEFLHVSLISTMGIAFAATTLMSVWFGADPRPVPAYVSETPFKIGTIPLRPTYVVLLVVACVITALIEIVMVRTDSGRMFRATLEDPPGAELQGIDTKRIVVGGLCVGGMLAALAGFLIAPVVSASPFAADKLTFFGFAAMTIGGFGSFRGAVVGALAVGLIGGLTPIGLEPHWVVPITWTALLLMLLVRPSGIAGTAGLFGAKGLREG
jgi:branched-subunit amino acid ABC-type transport system permease component